MKKYYEKPNIVEAYEWFATGNMQEGVELYLLPDMENICSTCNKKLKEHGLVKAKLGYNVACSGDYVCKNVFGYFVVKRKDFFLLYEEVSA